MWDLSNCCTTGKLRNLNSGKPANPVCSRVDRSAPICAGMGVGRPGLKLAERRAIWRPGVASRAAVGARRGRSPGCRRGWGGKISGFQIFREQTLKIALAMTALCPQPTFVNAAIIGGERCVYFLSLHLAGEHLLTCNVPLVRR